MAKGPWFTTRSALFQPGDHVWAEVARYEAPLRELLARRYSAPGWGLDAADREDLLQGILLEIKERLIDTFEGSRGSFRGLLFRVVQRRVVDHLRAKRETQAEALEAIAAPERAEVDAVDLEASLVRAVAECHDHFTGGAARDLEIVWTLTDRVVGGLGNKEIAAKRGYTERQVAGRLTRARERIFASLLARELDLEPGSEPLVGAVQAFRACLRSPRHQAAILEALPDPSLSERLEDFFARFRAGLAMFRGSSSVRYQELAAGVLSVFEEAAALPGVSR